MRRLWLAILIFILFISNAYAVQSTIMDAEGYACMGTDKSRKETEQEAMADAKRNAVENAITHIKSETKVKDFQIEKDIIDSYTNASVTVLEKKEASWYKDEKCGDCYRVKLRAEVIPDEKAVQKAVSGKADLDNPGLPLNVQLWTDKKGYQNGERIKIYIKGNKPFYARVIYRDSQGNLLQLLPNPFRKDNYFNGGVIYEIPSGEDEFVLEVNPPFGEEQIILYSSTSPLGDINLKNEGGGIYQVTTKEKDIGMKTRGIALKGKTGSKNSTASEFFEDHLQVKTAH